VITPTHQTPVADPAGRPDIHTAADGPAGRRPDINTAADPTGRPAADPAGARPDDSTRPTTTTTPPAGTPSTPRTDTNTNTGTGTGTGHTTRPGEPAPDPTAAAGTHPPVAAAHRPDPTATPPATDPAGAATTPAAPTDPLRATVAATGADLTADQLTALAEHYPGLPPDRAAALYETMAPKYLKAWPETTVKKLFDDLIGWKTHLRPRADHQRLPGGTGRLWDDETVRKALDLSREKLSAERISERIFEERGRAPGATTIRQWIADGGRRSEAEIRDHRRHRGERHPHAKLDWEKVREIRTLIHAGNRRTDKQFGLDYGVSRRAIGDVRKGESWQDERWHPDGYWITPPDAAPGPSHLQPPDPGPDYSGPDYSGPDYSGPDYSGPDYSGPGWVAAGTPPAGSAPPSPPGSAPSPAGDSGGGWTYDADYPAGSYRMLPNGNYVAGNGVEYDSHTGEPVTALAPALGPAYDAGLREMYASPSAPSSRAASPSQLHHSPSHGSSPSVHLDATPPADRPRAYLTNYEGDPYLYDPDTEMGVRLGEQHDPAAWFPW